jgi:hypothetical protein
MKPKYLRQHFIILILIGFVICSCTKVINVDLNSASPQIVVQANLPNELASDTVQLNQTVNFSDPNSFPAITGALVTINDNAGNSDTLSQSKSGIYTSSRLTGIPGRGYTLTIVASGKTYTGTCTMPAPVPIDTLIVGKAVFGKNLQVTVQFKDPAGISNYYRFIEIINHTVKQRNYVTDDELQDGQIIKFPLFGDNDSIQAGDSVRVILQCIDKGTYQYYISLNSAKGGGGANVAPANPTSNMSNGALGYFNVYSFTEKSIIIP